VSISFGKDRPRLVNVLERNRPWIFMPLGLGRPRLVNVLELSRPWIFMPLGLGRTEHVYAFVAEHGLKMPLGTQRSGQCPSNSSILTRVRKDFRSLSPGLA